MFPLAALAASANRSTPPLRSLLIGIGVVASCLCTAPFAHCQDEFETHVRPLLVGKCLNCHGSQKSESGLRLNSLSDATRGGDSGSALIAGDAAGSLLLKAIKHEDGMAMPPDEKLPDETIAAVERWIASGAAWPEALQDASRGPALRSGPIQPAELQHWAYQPFTNAAIPDVDNSDWNGTPIDRFVYSKLAASDLHPHAPVDRATLIRRASFDLTGLPPTPEATQAFIDDQSPDAFAQLVDRLLASPAYGQRWGRHWLDLVRYADTAGEGADFPVPQAYKYRNWVIDAFNRDQPYDEFLTEQLAGDRLAALEAKQDANIDAQRYRDLMIATGFIAVSRRFGFDPENYQHLTIQDTIDTVGQSVLGLTLGCARCHDHKFDPVTMQDYYGWYGIFSSTRYTFPGSEQKPRPYDLCEDVPPQIAQQLKAQLEQRVAAAAQEEQAKLRGELPYGLIYGAIDRDAPADAAIQLRGEPEKPGTVALRRNLEILGSQPLDASTGSGRLELARWLTSAQNPLTSRVMVNRIWQYHFGRGLVSSSNDFGVRGSLPSHPELLDWLALEFQQSGYSIKSMHRLIMNTAAYQQSSDTHPSNNSAALIKDAVASLTEQQIELEYLKSANQQHAASRPEDKALEARIQSFETAFGMQAAAPEALDLSQETAETLALYGIKPGQNTGFGWQCLAARRLAERGVRFIELIDVGSSNNWDAHGDMATHAGLAANVDQALAGLLTDLERRGMLDDTLVVWTTEFGRTPYHEKADHLGREHHHNVFSSWMAGGGLKRGIVHGESDEFGIGVAKDRVHVHDFHATILHLLGIDHERLTFRHAGRDYRLTDVHGHVVNDIIA